MEKKVMKMPSVGESINEVVISKWIKKSGDKVSMDETICEIESDKATFEIPAEFDGILRLIKNEGDTLLIGDEICEIIIDNKLNDDDNSFKISPVAANIMASNNISLEDIKVTGQRGRVLKDDVLNVLTGRVNTSPSNKEDTNPEKEKLKKDEIKDEVKSNNRIQNRVKMSSIRKTISKRLVSVKNETAMLTTFNEVDMKPIMDIRYKYKDIFKSKYGVNLGFMSFFTKATCIAIKDFPVINSYIDGDDIITNDYIDISIAVSAPRGLVVPVIRDANKLSFDEIEKEIVKLAMLAKENKLTLEQMSGGTFTITNGGVFGSMLSTPIINSPQSAILGMHNIVERPVVVNGEITIRPIMYLALSYDHRLIDGRDSVGFLCRIKELLEEPNRILLDI